MGYRGGWGAQEAALLLKPTTCLLFPQSVLISRNRSHVFFRNRRRAFCRKQRFWGYQESLCTLWGRGRGATRRGRGASWSERAARAPLRAPEEISVRGVLRVRGRGKSNGARQAKQGKGGVTSSRGCSEGKGLYEGKKAGVRMRVLQQCNSEGKGAVAPCPGRRRTRRARCRWRGVGSQRSTPPVAPTTAARAAA